MKNIFNKKKLIIPSIGILVVGLVMMFFMPYIKNDIGKIVYGSISCLIMILGYVSIPTILNSIVRQEIPKSKEGVFMGVKMIFVVALPMCIGPFIGDAMNKISGLTYTDDFGTVSYVPSNYNYLAAIGVVLFALIPAIFVLKFSKEKGEKVDEK